MKITRRQLRSALEREAARPGHAPSSSFLDALERRVLGDDALLEALAPVPIHRGRRAGIAVAVAVASLAAASVAAALPAMRSGRVLVVPASYYTTTVTNPIAPIASTSTVSPTVTTGPTSTSLQTGSTELSLPNNSDPNNAANTSSTTLTSVTIATTSPGVVPSTPATVPAPTLVPTTLATVAPATQPTTTTLAATTTSAAAATSTSEPSVPASLSIQCAAISTSSIRCTWSQSSDGRVAGYRLLRGVDSGPGRVFSTGAGDSGYTDTVPVSGVRYSFLVHAVDASGTSLGHSQLVYVTCCTP